MDKVNSSPAHDTLSKNMSDSIQNLESKKARKVKYLEGLYPDYRRDIISLELYKTYKVAIEKEITERNARISKIKAELDGHKNSTHMVDDFIEKLKKHNKIIN